MRRLLVAALLLAGCADKKGDSLVVVTVGADPPLLNVVALLRTSSTAGSQTMVHDHDFGVGSTPFSLSRDMPKTFAVQVPSSVTGTFTIHVAALDVGGNVLGEGDGSTTLSPGKISYITITLGASSSDGGSDGGSDDGGMPQIPSVAVWIGSGGSALSSSMQQLNLSVGGSDTVGVTSAPSGASLGGGFFSSQDD
jgi:hypothetical protein